MLCRPSATTGVPVPKRVFGSYEDVLPLLQLCAEGKLYEVESWIDAGRPLQYPPPSDRKLQRVSTALQLAVERGFHSLAALLLANGYDPNGDYYECLSPAVRARNCDMVRLLLRFGADPRAVDFAEVLETCDRQLMDVFVEAGVDPCAKNALARALGTTRHPILGFVKQYRDRFPAMQRQIDIALRVATENDRARGVALMLWLGGDPYATTPSSAEEGEGDGFDSSAIESAMWRKPEILDAILKRPIPEGQLNHLLYLASSRCQPRLVERLLNQGADPNYAQEGERPLLWQFISPVLWIFRTSKDEVDRGLEALEIMLKAGASFKLSNEDLKRFRRDLLDGESRVVIRVIELLEQHKALSPDQIRELTRTPSMKRLLAGHSKPRRSFGWEPTIPAVAYSAPVQESRGGYWKRHWWQR